MKNYPYTNSTELVIYEPKVKQKKKPKIWLACLSSALCASIITAGVTGAGLYIYQNNRNNFQKGTDNLVIGQQNSNIVRDAQQIANQSTANVDGKTVLTTEEIAAVVGPSVVGVINKAKLQAQKYYDPFSGRSY